MEREYNYNEVYMQPQKYIVNSRSECDISVQFGPRKFRNPVIAANMKSVVDFETCHYLARKGMFYIMHRFHLSLQEIAAFIKVSNKEHGFSSISIGIQPEDRENISLLSQTIDKPTYVTIDVAHAHSDRTITMIEHVKTCLPETFLIVGNVASPNAVEDLQDAGADALKVFVAPGAACTTKVKTGFTRGTVSCLLDLFEYTDVPLIADGGIREPGHIAVAMACGASMVMVGSYLSGFDQNSGDVVEINGHKKYIYYGSASFNNKRTKKHVEGKEIILDYKGSMDDQIYDVECSLRSAVSYGGCRDLKGLMDVPLFYMAQ